MPVPLLVIGAGLVAAKIVAAGYLWTKVRSTAHEIAFPAERHLEVRPVQAGTEAVFRDPMVKLWLDQYYAEVYRIDIVEGQPRLVFRNAEAAGAFLQRWEPESA